MPALAAVLVAGAAAGCGAESGSDRANRASSAIERCRGHEGVSAFDDDAVICADGTFHEERGSGAVQACRDHGGVAAFDDDIVICDDQTFHRVAGG